MPTLIPTTFYGAKSSLLKNLVADFEGFEASGSAIDATLRGNDLTAVGVAPGAVLTSAPGIQTYSRSFSDAFGNKLNRASTADLQAGGGVSFVIEAWFFGRGVLDVMVSKWDNATKNEYLLYSSGGNVVFYVTTNVSAYFAQVANPSAGAWHQALAWYDADLNTVNLRIDNGVVNSAPTAGAIVSNTAEFTIGNFETGALLFNGKLCPVRIWKGRVLTSTEQDLLWNSGAGLLYPFDATPPAINSRQFAGFPVLLRLSTGAFKLYWNNGEDHSLTNAIIRQETSADFVTWAHGSDLEADDYLAVVAAQQLANGDIIRLCQRGLSPTVTTEVFISTDDGATWDAGAVVANPLTSWIQPYGRPYQLAGGDILAPAFGENLADSTRSILLKSADGGATWTLQGTIAYDGTNVLDYTETSMVHVSGTTFFSVIRTYNGATIQNFRSSISVDDGATWAALVDIGFSGDSPELCYDGSGNLFLFYRNRANTRVSYRKSVDDGLNWGAEVVIYTDSDADCGYPSVQFDSGVFYLAYYRTIGTSVNVWSKTAASM